MASVSERIVQRVADTTDSDVSEVPTLYDAIDPDALDALGERTSSGVVSFADANHGVGVHSDGAISLDGRYPGGHSQRIAAGDP